MSEPAGVACLEAGSVGAESGVADACCLGREPGGIIGEVVIVVPAHGKGSDGILGIAAGGGVQVRGTVGVAGGGTDGEGDCWRRVDDLHPVSGRIGEARLGFSHRRADRVGARGRVGVGDELAAGEPSCIPRTVVLLVSSRVERGVVDVSVAAGGSVKSEASDRIAPGALTVKVALGLISPTNRPRISS